MDKLKMETEDLTFENIEKMKELFPSVVSDGKIDFDKLKQELSADIVRTVDSYDFTWVGKHEAVRKANEPVNAVLRPCPEESKNWEKTKNIYIEGDNLDVLKVLYKSYAGQIKMIYIDPPYNTGSDLIYNDTFTQNLKEYNSVQHLSDEQGLRLKKVTDTDGNYHSKWCSMMYPRLKIARKLLSEDGVIFISIDDHEQANLKKICDEIFGENNFVGTYLKQSKVGGGSDSKFIVKEHEYCIVYVKDNLLAEEMFIKHDDEYIKRYKEKDEKGMFFWDTFARPGLKNPIIYDIIAPDGTIIRNGWIHSEERFKKEYLSGDVRIIQKGNGEWSVQFKQYLNEHGKKPRSMTMDFGGSIEGKKDIGTLFENEKIFLYPKSVKYISTLLATISSSNSIILDFFSGSATTAHAVMQLNAEDGGNRKFIMVQVPEPCDEKSEYKNICEIGKERIRRAGEKIVADTGRKDLDIGFRVFKLDSSNMKDVYFTPDELIQKEGADIEDLADNVKPDRTPADLLFGVMQYWNMTECLGLPHATKEIDGRTIHIIQDGQFPELVACFDADVPETVIKEMAALNPLRAVFRERCFKTTQDRLNAERLLKNADIRLI